MPSRTYISLNNEIESLRRYFLSFRLKANFRGLSKLPDFKPLVRLLLVLHVMQKEGLPKRISKTALVYHSEVIADLLSTLFLCLLGRYKEANMVCRSACENYLKFILLSAEVDISSIDSVPKLFDVSVCTFPAGMQKEHVSRIGQLKTIYRDLNKFVHSVAPNYMTLCDTYEKMSSHDSSKADSALKYAVKLLKLVTELDFIWLAEQIYRLDHRPRDFILDSIPKGLKKIVYAKIQSN